MRKNFLFKNLQWDTKHFGVKSARIDILNELSQDDISVINQYIKENEFITIVNSKGLHLNNYYINTLVKAYLVDINIKFEKTITSTLANNKNINIKNNKKADAHLTKLAEKAFKNSRFLNDININSNKAKSLYGNWVKNSFNRQDKYFLTEEDSECINGFILFSMKEDFIIIELIAVDDKKRGSGIGKKLINNLNEFGYKNGVRVIEVGTQVENIGAINFYENCGYKIKDIKYIYHLWN